MARIWSSGFELNSASSGMEWSTVTGSVQIVTTPVRSGTYALQNNSFVSGQEESLRYNFKSSSNSGPFYFRAYLRITTLPSAANQIIRLRTSGGVMMVYVSLDSSGILHLGDEDGEIGVAGSALSTGQWYRLEIEFAKIGVGADVCKLYVDGTQVAGATNRSIGTGVAQFVVGANLASEAQTTGSWHWDDCAINDNTGSYENGLPGAGSIVHLRPNAAGAASDWTNDYLNVDEVTPNDATDLVASNTLNATDDHNIDNTPSGIPPQGRIKVVQMGVRFNGAGASANASFVLRITAGGSTDETPAITPSNATWITNASAAPLNYPVFANNSNYEKPGTDRRWKKADLDSAQIGYRLSSTSTNNAQITAVWLLVEYDDTLLFDSVKGGIAFGEASPTNSEAAVSYQNFDNGAGSLPTISGDPDWGKISLTSGQEARSKVYDFGDANTRLYTLNRDVYGTGTGSATLQIRGSSSSFTQDDNTVSWVTYTAPTSQSWRYVQIRIVGV